MSEAFIFKCPVCSEPLSLKDRSYLCENRHSYDLSRQGYVNLLLSQHKRSRHPGDSDEMILSRQRFLEKGYYQILAQALVHSVSAQASGLTGLQRILDLGCGEGYYLQALRQAESDSERFKLAGIDISKRAVHELAKRKLGVQVAVASSNNLPFFDQSFDLLLSIFAPLNVQETHRVLAPGGQLLMVGPAEAHLEGLMREIYTEVFQHKGNFVGLDASPEFQLLETLEIQESISVAGEDILDLLTMTPYYWHTPPERKAQLEQLSQLETPIHFYLKRYAKV